MNTPKQKWWIFFEAKTGEYRIYGPVGETVFHSSNLSEIKAILAKLRFVCP